MRLNEGKNKEKKVNVRVSVSACSLRRICDERCDPLSVLSVHDAEDDAPFHVASREWTTKEEVSTRVALGEIYHAN